LAPFFVQEKFRGRGVASMLLRWAIDQADKVEPPVWMYLEALPNARPVYLHAGFRGVEGEGREMVMVRRGTGSEVLSAVDLGEKSKA
jgi:GNAT superfamily N-acetyltransferase